MSLSTLRVFLKIRLTHSLTHLRWKISGPSFSGRASNVLKWTSRGLSKTSMVLTWRSLSKTKRILSLINNWLKLCTFCRATKPWTPSVRLTPLVRPSMRTSWQTNLSSEEGTLLPAMLKPSARWWSTRCWTRLRLGYRKTWLQGSSRWVRAVRRTRTCGWASFTSRVWWSWAGWSPFISTSLPITRQTKESWYWTF